MTKTIQKIPQQLQGAISKKPQQAFMSEKCKEGHQTSKFTEVPTTKVNYTGGQQRSYNNFQQRGFQNIHGNYNQMGDNKPQQRPNLWDCTIKLEVALTKLIEVVITNHKNTKVAIKSMETQIGQLAKQLQTSSIGFSTATEENPKSHCKAIISTIESDMRGEEEEEVEENIMLEEELKAQTNPSTQGMQSSLNPPLFDFSKLSIHKQGDDDKMVNLRNTWTC